METKIKKALISMPIIDVVSLGGQPDIIDCGCVCDCDCESGVYCSDNNVYVLPQDARDYLVFLKDAFSKLDVDNLGAFSL